MNKEKFTKFINLINFSKIEKVKEYWDKNNGVFSENTLRTLLVAVIESYDVNSSFNYFQKILDIIVPSLTTLNFTIDNYAPTLLSLSADKGSIKLFNYFIDKGADINFVSDSYIFDKCEYDRYSTCLDFVGSALDELLEDDSYFDMFNVDLDNIPFNEIESEDTIEISKNNYYNLVQQSQVLHEIKDKNKIYYRILSLGGKSIDELNNK